MTIRRGMLGMLGYSAFCILTLSANDVSLLDSGAKITLPIIDTTTGYTGFLLVGPIALIGLAMYLHVFLQSLWELGPSPDSLPLPFLFNVDNRFAALLSDILLYWIPVLVLFMFTWKALPLPYAKITLGLLTAAAGMTMTYLRLARTQTPGALARRGGSAAFLSFGALLILVATPAFLQASRPLLLDGADFGKAKLEGRQMSRASAEGAQFPGADLSGVDFQGADLKGANFDGANLTSAILRGAALEGASFDQAILRGADLRGAQELECEQLKDAVQRDLAQRTESCGLPQMIAYGQAKVPFAMSGELVRPADLRESQSDEGGTGWPEEIEEDIALDFVKQVAAQSGFGYRLPTFEEVRYAASASARSAGPGARASASDDHWLLSMALQMGAANAFYVTDCPASSAPASSICRFPPDADDPVTGVRFARNLP